jgi:hypothetical protein
MPVTLEHIFAEGASLLMTGLVATALFFLMAGLREIRNNQLQGLLFLTLALFFAGVHALYAVNLPADSPLARMLAGLGFWGWVGAIFAPALIGMYLVRGLVSFVLTHVRVGLIKLFFGLTLVCYLYMLGNTWPADVKGILIIIWGLTWLEVETSPAC